MKLLLIASHLDVPYFSRLKLVAESFPDLVIHQTLAVPSTLFEVAAICKAKGYSGVLVTSHAFLQKIVGTKVSSSEATINDYAGSYFKYGDIEYVVLRPLSHLVTFTYGEFLAKRFISKLATPEKWLKFPKFEWSIPGTNRAEMLEIFRHAKLIAVDIETGKTPVPYIKSIAYTGLFADTDSSNTKMEYTAYSIVFKIESMLDVEWMAEFNKLPAPKILQNGKYDINYLIMYNCPLYNYLLDTVNLFHCWYSELPKNLGFLQAFFVREAAYWKDLADSGDLQDKLLYNAKDTWATLMAALSALNEMPQWAIENYKNEFPLNFPAILCELTGIKRSIPRLKQVNEEWNKIGYEATLELSKMLGLPEGVIFNTASSKQKKLLLRLFGCGDIAEKSTDEKSLLKAAYRHPLISKLVNKILDIQEAKKLLSTYLVEGKEFRGQILYALNPHGTDTTRLASKEHHFWCGLQIQNIPRDGATVKSTLVAPPGWRIAECDLEQAESRDTAYAAGEERLIEAVSGDKDFHSLNAASFFGVSYEDIFDPISGKVRDKDRRDLGKKVNHGANYLMGANVLVATMGEEKVYKAGRLLGLPRFWTATQIAEELLTRFHNTYPGLSKRFYPAVVSEVMRTRMIASRATHDAKYQASSQGLIRYCFGDPVKNKRNKNAYVAHVAQSLNAQTLNRAFMVIFYEMAIAPGIRDNFRLLAQIHDSVLFLFREGHEYLCEEVRKRMEIPVTIKGYDGKVRTFTVPAAIKAGADGKGALNWGDI